MNRTTTLRHALLTALLLAPLSRHTGHRDRKTAPSLPSSDARPGRVRRAVSGEREGNSYQ